MEHHFHAAVRLGLEGLIEIGTASEIGAAVGDKEGRLPFLNLLCADPAFSRGSALASALRGPDHNRDDIVLVEFLNTTDPNTAPNRCAWCDRPETPDPTLRPIAAGADAAGYEDRGAAER
jgi:hypothetical protein